MMAETKVKDEEPEKVVNVIEGSGSPKTVATSEAPRPTMIGMKEPLDEIKKGGEYIVDGMRVNANGEIIGEGD
jgi:hypothetical protein